MAGILADVYGEEDAPAGFLAQITRQIQSAARLRERGAMLDRHNIGAAAGGAE